MLRKILRLNIANDGFKRQISLENIYINLDNIVSISDYSGIKNFLESENSELRGCNFSLIKYTSGTTVEDLIVKGKASEIMEDFSSKQKELLNG